MQPARHPCDAGSISLENRRLVKMRESESGAFNLLLDFKVKQDATKHLNLFTLKR